MTCPNKKKKCCFCGRQTKFRDLTKWGTKYICRKCIDKNKVNKNGNNKRSR